MTAQTQEFSAKAAGSSHGTEGGPRVGSFAAIAIGGALVFAATRSEAIVVWLLARGLASESSTRVLPDAIALIATAAGLLIGLAGWRIVGWPVARLRMPGALGRRVSAFLHLTAVAWSEFAGAASDLARSTRGFGTRTRSWIGARIAIALVASQATMRRVVIPWFLTLRAVRSASESIARFAVSSPGSTWSRSAVTSCSTRHRHLSPTRSAGP